MIRIAVWWRYQRQLGALIDHYLDQGYTISPGLYRQLQDQAREFAR